MDKLGRSYTTVPGYPCRRHGDGVIKQLGLINLTELVRALLVDSLCSFRERGETLLVQSAPQDSRWPTELQLRSCAVQQRTFTGSDPSVQWIPIISFLDWRGHAPRFTSVRMAPPWAPPCGAEYDQSRAGVIALERLSGYTVLPSSVYWWLLILGVDWLLMQRMNQRTVENIHSEKE